MQKKVCCLYRVSTEKQVDYNSNNEADIPMQRKACHKFALEKGWEIVHEEQEDGVSGHKVRAENRDKLQIIKELALKKQFDILLVFMFDRIGRIADETPFVVEWFVKNGIEVWSTQEGEQRFDNHVDKLLNYIRFWQADGESEKISIRTKTAHGQLVESGHFRGGHNPFGYDAVKMGRTNKRKYELYDLKVNDAEAEVVKIIFDKYTNEKHGAHSIATWLNKNGYHTREGKNWHPATICGILKNPTYIGVLRSGESRSDVIPELQIISPEQFEKTQAITNERSENHRANPSMPQNAKQKTLLVHKVFCGHCGSRLNITTSGRYRTRADGSVDLTERIRYSCYGKTRKRADCNGQTGYTTHKLDEKIDDIIKIVFAKVNGISIDDVINARCNNELELRKARVIVLKADYIKEKNNLNRLKAEVAKSIKGESSFSTGVLAKLFAESEEECNRLYELYAHAEREVSDTENLHKQISDDYDQLISWAKIYNGANIEKKAIIINDMIKRIEVFRDYKVKIYFNVNLEQFGIDVEAE